MFRSKPSFEMGFEQMATSRPDNHLTRSRQIRLFKITVRECEKAFANGDVADDQDLADSIAAKFQSSILITIGIAVVIELIKIWIQKLRDDWQT